MLETYRHRYEHKQSESTSLSKNLDSVREDQASLMKEHKDLEDKPSQLKRQNEHQKTDIQVLKKELDSKELNYFLNRRRFMDTLQDDRWLREVDLERSSSSKYRYWHWRPWLYRHYRDLYDKYYPSPYYYGYPYYNKYSHWPYSSLSDWTVRRKWELEDKMSEIQRMTDDLKLNNYRMLSDLKGVKSAIEH